MRIVKTSYEAVGARGKDGGTLLITTFRVKGLRLRELVPVPARRKPEAAAKRKR
ncbi:hypothetical protein KW799_00680 [Candidatus Parcubacteria bacterium]|nr:hypothetical protein [Candidatus Parcubacteria bacterium]